MSRKITDALKESNGLKYSIELIPPLVQNGTETLYGTIERFRGIKTPVFVSLTYHQQHLDVGKTDTGYEANLALERPGTIMLSHRLAEAYPDTIVVPHIICGGFSAHETQAALVELGYAGNISTVLALRGDPPYPYRDFKPAREGHSHASQLVKQIADLREGRYVGKETKGVPVDFEIGVAAYPERHKEAPNFGWDLRKLKEKQELGADFAITQMFFDNEQYKRFLEMCERQNITIPIIPGITPITRKDQLTMLPHRFGCTIPDSLVTRIQDASDDDVKRIGIEFTLEQSRSLIANGSPMIHFFTYGASKTVQDIVKQLLQ